MIGTCYESSDWVSWVSEKLIQHVFFPRTLFKRRAITLPETNKSHLKSGGTGRLLFRVHSLLVSRGVSLVSNLRRWDWMSRVCSHLSCHVCFCRDVCFLGILRTAHCRVFPGLQRGWSLSRQIGLMLRGAWGWANRWLGIPPIGG